MHTPFSFGQLFQCSSVGFEPLAVAGGDSERKEGMVIYSGLIADVDMKKRWIVHGYCETDIHEFICEMD